MAGIFVVRVFVEGALKVCGQNPALGWFLAIVGGILAIAPIALQALKLVRRI